MTDLSKIKKIYFIGIKGVAMSGLAVICQQRGLAVAGSDVAEKFITDKILDQAKIKVFENFALENLDWGPDLVVIGTSWDKDNVEVAESLKRKIPSISDSQLRGLLSTEKETIAVTGVHGKTTTTAMLAHIFKHVGLKPSYLIGTGAVPDLGSNAAWDLGKHFIVEGDEYSRSRNDKTPKFLDLKPAITIITSLEWEHVDVYPNLEAIEKVFSQLIDNTKDLIVACGDWPSIKKISGGKDEVVTYGLNDGSLWQAYDIVQDKGGTTFKVRKESIDIDQFFLKLYGQHNVSNALACIIVALKVGIDQDKTRQALSVFSGTERRFEVMEKAGVVFVDDYGHHPSEIKATLQAVRKRYPTKKIWCVFQPHMASRTKALLADFGQSFSDVDKVLVPDIFTSAREKNDEINSKDLAQEIAKNHESVIYSGSLEQTVDGLRGQLDQDTVLVTMGAGDVYLVRDKLISS